MNIVKMNLKSRMALLCVATLFVLSGCGSISKSTVDSSKGAATIQDRFALSKIAEKNFYMAIVNGIEAIAESDRILEVPNSVFFEYRNYVVSQVPPNLTYKNNLYPFQNKTQRNRNHAWDILEKTCKS